MQFTELNLIDPLLRAVHDEGYRSPTPIQAQAIPHILAGKNLVGCAQTGTGKTAAFALPILQRLIETPNPNSHKAIRALVLSPTRELASQIQESFSSYGRFTKVRATVIFGGVGQSPQVDALKRGADVVVATPGRLLDLMNQGYVKLNTIEIFVLDEADRMLDMGFIHDVRKIISALPTRRQTLLFSATMPPAIQSLADQMMFKPVRVEVTPQATTVERITQSVYYVDKSHKRALLEYLLSDHKIRRVLVFTRTKHGANKLAEQLERADINAEAIHGNKSQSARERALANFKNGTTRVLVATDIAARGIDVDDVTHVINYDLPNEPETYVHRIGRTARAGADGAAYSFCDHEEKEYLRDIEKLIRLRVPIVEDHPYPMTELAIELPANLMHRSRPSQPQRQGQRPSSRNGSSTGSSSSSSSSRSTSSGQRRSEPGSSRRDNRQPVGASSSSGDAPRKSRRPQPRDN